MTQETTNVEYPHYPDDYQKYPTVQYSQYPTLINFSAHAAEAYAVTDIPVEKIKKGQKIIDVAAEYFQKDESNGDAANKTPALVFMEYRTKAAVIRVRFNLDNNSSNGSYEIEYIFTSDPSKYSYFFTWDESLVCYETKQFPFMNKTFSDIEKEIVAGLDFIAADKQEAKEALVETQ